MFREIVSLHCFFFVKKMLNLFMVALFVLGFSIQTQAGLSGCYPEPAEATIFKQCPDGLSYVIRCSCGGGYCEPSNQGFCDRDDPQQ